MTQNPASSVKQKMPAKFYQLISKQKTHLCGKMPAFEEIIDTHSVFIETEWISQSHGLIPRTKGHKNYESG